MVDGVCIIMDSRLGHARMTGMAALNLKFYLKIIAMLRENILIRFFSLNFWHMKEFS